MIAGKLGILGNGKTIKKMERENGLISEKNKNTSGNIYMVSPTVMERDIYKER
jgi:hypothetical protein